MYPYTVTDDRVERNKKRKDNGKEFFRRGMRKFSYHETLLCHICSNVLMSDSPSSTGFSRFEYVFLGEESREFSSTT